LKPVQFNLIIIKLTRLSKRTTILFLCLLANIKNIHSLNVASQKIFASNNNEETTTNPAPTSLNSDSIKFKDIYSRLFNILTAKDSISSGSVYFFMSLKYGNDNIDDINLFYQKHELSHDSIYKLLNISNQNYLKYNPYSFGNFDILFRFISLSDQIYRTDCYFKKKIPYSEVQKNDSILQLLFIPIINNYKEFSYFDGSFFSKTFTLLLIHSTASWNTRFFENYFKIYAKGHNNNFVEFPNLKNIFDLYLKIRYNKQYFNTPFGQGLKSNGKWGLLDEINHSDLVKIFNELGIEKPILP